MSYRDQIAAFVDAFNVDDLEAVMRCFAADAEYITLEGRHCRGKAAIRAEFEAQFAGRYGRLRFVRERLLVDEAQQEAAVSWRCEHLLVPGADATALRWLQRSLSVVTGRRPYWQGVDLFRFRDGLLIGKYTYGQTRLPLFHRGD
ncbi:MAG: nuclear transport factor 2 family protein [Moraxellaceae bacterium]|nr:nuclear transport factor 2 family protein [Moraxellaceae bacterium]